MGRSNRIKIFCTVILPLLLTINSLGQYNLSNPLIIDRTNSAVVGAHNLITLHRGIYEAQNIFLKPRWFEENNFGIKMLGITYRLSKTVLIDNVIDHLAFLIQHEVFGHGARFREFGFSGNTYKLNPIFPYGNSGGWAISGIPEPGRNVTPHESIMITIGGSEANTILANVLRTKWLLRGSINYRETALYLSTANDLSMYVLFTRYFSRKGNGNDILRFLQRINSYEGYRGEANYKLTLDDLADQAWINLLNPFLYFSVYTYLYTYLWSGNEAFIIPMIRFRDIKYLPSFRIGLTPFGTEFYFENIFLYSDKFVEFQLRYGDPTFHRYWGVGVHVINLIQGSRASLNLRASVWNQPHLMLGGERVIEKEEGYGGALIGTMFYNVSESNLLIQNMFAEVGYKSAGFLGGERISGGFIVRLGVGLIDF